MFILIIPRTPEYLVKKYFRKEKSKPIIYKSFKKFIYDEKLFLGANLINGQLASQLKSDNLTKRNLIRHNPEKLGKFLVENFLN